MLKAYPLVIDKILLKDLMKLKPTSVQDQGQAQQMKAQPQQDNVNLSDSQKKVNWQKQQQDLFNQKKHPSQSQGIMQDCLFH